VRACVHGMSRLAAEQQIEPGKRVADHHQHHRQLACELMTGGQEPQCAVVRRDHGRDVSGHHTPHLDGGQQRWMHRQHVVHLGVTETGQQDERLLSAFDEVREVVGDT